MTCHRFLNKLQLYFLIRSNLLCLRLFTQVVDIMTDTVKECKNRLIILEEDLYWHCCEVYGLDLTELTKVREELRKKHTSLGELYDNEHDLKNVRASDVIPLLESLGYEFYQVSEKFEKDENNFKICAKVLWKFMKKV